MHKHAETFHAYKEYKFKLLFYTNFIVSQIGTGGTLLKRYLNGNEALFFVRKLIVSTLSFKWLETNDNVFSHLGPLFPTSPFFRVSLFSKVQVPSLGPVFRRCTY